jgi:hypothetical protein
VNDTNIIAWNVTNWVTVILMASVGFFIFGIGLKYYQSKTGGGQPSKAAS